MDNGKIITGYTLPEFVLELGGSIQPDESFRALGCCRFLAAVNKWYTTHSSASGLLQMAATLMPDHKSRYIIGECAKEIEHMFSELHGVIQVGMHYDGFPCEGGEAMRCDETKGLTLIKK